MVMIVDAPTRTRLLRRAGVGNAVAPTAAPADPEAPYCRVAGRARA